MTAATLRARPASRWALSAPSLRVRAVSLGTLPRCGDNP